MRWEEGEVRGFVQSAKEEEKGMSAGNNIADSEKNRQAVSDSMGG